MRHLLIAVAFALLAALAVAQDSIPAPRPRPFLRGVCLTLHDEDPDRDYTQEVAEIASRLGASHVSVVFHLFQPKVDSKAPARGDETPSDEALRRILRDARAHGLGAVLMPIVLIEDPLPGEWRGKLEPKDPGAWLDAYRDLLVGYARLAAEEKASSICIGSELGWCEKDPRWRPLIAAVRAVFPGKLTYSANWDDYENVPFWDALDYVGLSGYYELAQQPGASVAALRDAWCEHRDAILAWRRRTVPQKPLVFMELGYPSQVTAAMHPWDYTSAADLDLDEQRRCYEAFVAAWAKTTELQGVFFYEWWGEGGSDDRGYTPRGKPAEAVVRSFFSDLRVLEKRR